MDTDKHGLFAHRRRRKIAIAFLCFFVVYGLSIGPMAKLEDYGIICKRTDKVLNVFYAPLYPLAKVPAARQLFDWHIFHVWKYDAMGEITF